MVRFRSTRASGQAASHESESSPALTRRDAAAEDVGAVLTLDVPRTDDPLTGVSAPQQPQTPDVLAGQPAHLDQLRAEPEARPSMS